MKTIHHRQTMRLKNWDYASMGYYFVTICTQNRYPYFTNHDVSIMITNTCMKMVHKYQNVVLDKFVVMPNHIHGINQSGWERFNKKLWQRNYYKHIIRSEESLNTIRQYINNNPPQWHLDKNPLHRDILRAS